MVVDVVVVASVVECVVGVVVLCARCCGDACLFCVMVLRVVVVRVLHVGVVVVFVVVALWRLML